MWKTYTWRQWLYLTLYLLNPLKAVNYFFLLFQLAWGHDSQLAPVRESQRWERYSTYDGESVQRVQESGTDKLLDPTFYHHCVVWNLADDMQNKDVEELNEVYNCCGSRQTWIAFNLCNFVWETCVHAFFLNSHYWMFNHVQTSFCILGKTRQPIKVNLFTVVTGNVTPKNYFMIVYIILSKLNDLFQVNVSYSN